MPLVQRFSVQTDSQALLLQYLEMAATTALSASVEIAVKVVDENADGMLNLPTAISENTKHFPVLLVSGWYAPADGKANRYFNGFGPWMTFRGDLAVGAVNSMTEHVQALLEARSGRWTKKFLELFGAGYTDVFNEHDGTIGVGYELRTCDCFPQVLAIGLVHIYYGK